jgi:hypothetical protein
MQGKISIYSPSPSQLSQLAMILQAMDIRGIPMAIPIIDLLWLARPFHSLVNNYLSLLPEKR